MTSVSAERSSKNARDVLKKVLLKVLLLVGVFEPGDYIRAVLFARLSVVCKCFSL